MRSELQRRETRKDALRAYLQAHEGEWIEMSRLATIGGIGGWRTRLSELDREGFRVEWNKQPGSASKHRHISYQPLARDASMPTQQKSLF